MWTIALAWAAPADLAAELVDLDDQALLTRLAQEMGRVADSPDDVARLTEAMSIAKALAEADLPPAARRGVVEAMVSEDPADRAWARKQVQGDAPSPTAAAPPALSDAYENRKLSLGPIQRTQTTVTTSWVVTSSWQDWTVYEGGYRALDGLEASEILGDDTMVRKIKAADRTWNTSGAVSLVGGAVAAGAGVVLLDGAFEDLETGPDFWAGTALLSGGAGAVTFGLIAVLTKSFKHRFASLAYKKDIDGLQQQVDSYNADLRQELGIEP